MTGGDSDNLDAYMKRKYGALVTDFNDSCDESNDDLSIEDIKRDLKHF